ncbi:Hypothetical Protein RradSPS_1348 [Rubrobacter radiotolerans]|uniref:Uncharacterized protein n=1 Tax=Rubrobacter radiotolerans TaxID=42256 RepID=A0A023X380_RUBRA|nr:hypothetical protein [Rubrobacter radiotolerans]AHY46631.1 Hypothetical Protein RradSPS_1348 [Rubrobacter radiotolerans]MDX5894038.1 hypothetical protein [Rubrobacter radiotolerans]SMC05040.1 hypothetical protein SAMN00767673_1347 [Rubrobacter radiotolerans DSM 5868]
MSNFLHDVFGALRDRRLMIEVSLWGLFWSVALTFSIGIFGHVPALVTVTGLALFVSYVWYRTAERDRELERARERARSERRRTARR